VIPFARHVYSDLVCPAGIKCTPLYPSLVLTSRTPFPGSILPHTPHDALLHQMRSLGRRHLCCHELRVFISGSALGVAICWDTSHLICLFGDGGWGWGEQMNVRVPFLSVVMFKTGELAGVHRANRQLLTNRTHGTHPPNRIILIMVIVPMIKSV